MKMLQLIAVSEYGGAEKATFLQIKQFAMLGYDVTFIFPPGEYSDKYRSLEKQGVKVIEYPLRQKNFIKSALFLNKIIKNDNFRIIHSHKYLADFLLWLSCIFRKKVLKISSVHELVKYSEYSSRLKKFQCYIFSLIAYHGIDHIFSNSDEVTRVTAEYFHLAERKITTAINGIDFEELKPDMKNVEKLKGIYKSGVEDKIVLCAGALYEKKGQGYLLEAAGRYLKEENIKYILLGKDSGDKDNYIALSNKFGIQERVFFPGFVDNVPDWLYICDIFILPSLNEALPRALLEAMYMKKPCITSDISTLKAVVTHMDNGIIVKNRSSKEIADAIYLLMKDKELSARIAENGHNFVKNNCSIESMVSKMDREIRKLVSD